MKLLDRLLKKTFTFRKTILLFLCGMLVFSELEFSTQTYADSSVKHEAAIMNSVLGVPWGASMDQVEKTIKDKGFKVGILSNAVSGTSPSFPSFDNRSWDEFAGYHPLKVEFSFSENSFNRFNAIVCLQYLVEQKMNGGLGRC
jgi:hypothetical protein